MVARTFFKKCFVLAFLLFTVVSLLSFYKKNKLNDEEASDNITLNFELKSVLLREVMVALSSYRTTGWKETYKSLDEIHRRCEAGSCDPEVFFNEISDDLANTFDSDQEFSLAAFTLGIIYSGNWRSADLDSDGTNEIIMLQRDALNVNYTLLKVINFLRAPRVIAFKLPQGYFSSPNSSGLGTLPLEIRDINNDGPLEVFVYVSPGRGGSDLNIFTYSDGRLDLIYKKDDIEYPEYTVSDKDRDGVAELTIEGFRNSKRVKELIKLQI